jgi:hypothetical protein
VTTGSEAPSVLAATYTDVAAGQPGYALVVNPGPSGSGRLGGVAVYQYQDGAETAYFSFSGTATSVAPFSLSIKGDRAGASVMAQISAATTDTASSITIENCAPFFSPAQPNRIPGTTGTPGAPPSCTFTYKLAPGPARTQPTVPTNLTATPAIKGELLSSYLAQNGWQSYASSITNAPGGTYVAYDPQTGLNWAYATFAYSGPDITSGNSPAVGMQDGGDQGYFYQIPISGSPSSASGGWIMVGAGGYPDCYSTTVVPLTVISLWSLSDAPACTSAG